MNDDQIKDLAIRKLLQGLPATEYRATGVRSIMEAVRRDSMRRARRRSVALYAGLSLATAGIITLVAVLLHRIGFGFAGLWKASSFDFFREKPQYFKLYIAIAIIGLFLLAFDHFLRRRYTRRHS